MNRKLKNTLALLAILLLIIIGGSIFSFFVQKGKIDEKTKELNSLNANTSNTEELLTKLDNLKIRAAELDSILSLRKFNIPVGLLQSDFYDFVNKISFNFAPDSYVNIEYADLVSQVHYNYFTYKLSGTAYFNDVYKLIYAIEQSKSLKKILTCNFKNFVSVDDEETPHYYVNYTFKVAVYFSDDDQYASAVTKENRLVPNPIYDIFYPLIRNEIPPNIDDLLDVQAAQLLALIPEGAFIADSKGVTYLLWEGDQVYLGYLTEIDYDKNEVHFVLNKGGIIEKVTLELDKIDNEKKE